MVAMDTSDSDMSRLTTMLEQVGTAFERGHGPKGERTVEIGNLEFLFDQYGHLLRVRVTPDPENARLIEALRHISAPKYGLQGLIENSASEEEIGNHWRDLAQSYEQEARDALYAKRPNT